MKRNYFDLSLTFKLFNEQLSGKLIDLSTIKPVYNTCPWNPEIVAVIKSLSLFKAVFLNQWAVDNFQSSHFAKFCCKTV